MSHYILYIYVNKDNQELYDKYVEHVAKHNEHISYSEYPNAGFDLLCPYDISIDMTNLKPFHEQVKLNTDIACGMIKYNTNKSINVGYYLYPRSSIIKTNLRLANSVGIIDSGYRGNIMGVFDIINNNNINIQKYSRLLQITAPSLKPFYVKMVDNIHDLGITERGSGGFGSTGV
jgi:dUTP pyrophosphatase